MKEIQNQEWARLYTDQSEDSSEALKLLREKGYHVITFPVNGKSGPELKMGPSVFRGLEEIKKLIEN